MNSRILNVSSALMLPNFTGGFSPSSQLLALGNALDALGPDGRKSRVVELRYFGGLSIEETAEVLGVSVDTAKRDWRMAKGLAYKRAYRKTKLMNFRQDLLTARAIKSATSVGLAHASSPRVFTKYRPLMIDIVPTLRRTVVNC
jgi:hypothetical protein